MINPRKLAAATFAIALSAANFSALADMHGKPAAGSAPTSPPTSSDVAPPMTNGVVRKIDKEAKKITLRHEEITNLQMPGMTMVFQVKNAALLDRVKVGDKVRFSAEKQGSAIVVTAIDTTN